GEALGRIVGRWATRGEMKATPYSAAGPVAGELSCAWTAAHGFVVCELLVHHGTTAEEQLSIYRYSAGARAYAFVGLSPDGGPRTPELTLDGDVWTYAGESTIDGKTVRFRTTNRFGSASEMSWRSEYSEDGVHWLLLGEGSDTRRE